MKKFLIIKPSSFGDIVQALPVAVALKRKWPDAGVSWLVNTQYRRLLEDNPFIDDILCFERRFRKTPLRFVKAAASFSGLCNELRRGGFEAVLDLQGLLRSGFFSALTGAGERLGFANAREGAYLFYNRKVCVPGGDVHAVDRYLLLPEALGCDGYPAVFPLGIGDAEERWVDQVLQREGVGARDRLVGFLPTSRWCTKRWPAEYFAGLGDALMENGVKVMVIGGLAGEGADVMEKMTRPAMKALAVADPLRLAALLKRMNVVVSNDSGPMHLAAAVGTKVVALFGPTNPARTGPYGKGHKIICAPVACHPCYRRKCVRDPLCMREITVRSVCGAVTELLR
jgi:lipopolysaccharide heptosyltransferase I